MAPRVWKPRSSSCRIQASVHLTIRDQIIATADEAALWKIKCRKRIAHGNRRRMLWIRRNRPAKWLNVTGLLYVAMTRAEKWLIVAAAGEKGNKGDTWYEKVEAGIDRCRRHATHAFPTRAGPCGWNTAYWDDAETGSVATSQDRNHLMLRLEPYFKTRRTQSLGTPRDQNA